MLLVLVVFELVLELLARGNAVRWLLREVRLLPLVLELPRAAVWNRRPARRRCPGTA